MGTLRSLLFLLFQLFVTPFYAAVFLLMFWLPRVPRYKIARNWCRVNLYAARALCGIRWTVVGEENIPTT
ncbi:MAG TPA: 1-acyl-sn-glycerol-3-phosphate acyltransferase, partial [Casimicrobiaceae bacterium]|nr:1-acyl-sn-glycerol-3-phosphate acyltransferase [Casimicrobiaceae bacterium]